MFYSMRKKFKLKYLINKPLERENIKERVLINYFVTVLLRAMELFCLSVCLSVNVKT